jgi:hypothetical protein
VRLFRRRDDETLNERLLREAGYGPNGAKLDNASSIETTSVPLRPASLTSPVPYTDRLLPVAPGLRVGSWDAVAIAVEPGLRDDAYEFATVPDGSLIVDATCDEELSPLADALEAQLQPPYRAQAVRQDNGMWLVSGRQIEVIQLAAEGEELELSSLDGERIFSVDGRPADPASAPPALAPLGETQAADYAVHASRLDGDLWEIAADPL